MKRPTLLICTSCHSDDARGDGQTFYEQLKAARKEQKLKPFFRLKEAKCLDGCDTPCNARLKGGERPKVVLTWLDAIDDVQHLLDASKRYAETGEVQDFPGRPG